MESIKKKAEYTALLETRQWDVEILISEKVKFRETLLNSRASHWSVVTGSRSMKSIPSITKPISKAKTLEMWCAF